MADPAFSPWPEVRKVLHASLEGTRLVTQDSGGALQVWETKTWQSVSAPIPTRFHVDETALSRDEKRLWIAGHDGPGTAPLQVRIHELPGGRLLSALEPMANVGVACVDLDCRRMAILHGADVQVRNLDTGQVLWTVEVGPITGYPLSPSLRHGSAISCVAFSPNGRWLATGCRDGAVRIWDWATGEPLTPVLKRETAIRRIQFVADGSCLLVFPEDPNSRTWFGLGHLLQLPKDPGAREDWITLAGLLAGHRLDHTGTLEPLTPIQLSNAFAALRLRLPGDSRPRETDR